MARGEWIINMNTVCCVGWWGLLCVVSDLVVVCGSFVYMCICVCVCVSACVYDSISIYNSRLFKSL